MEGRETAKDGDIWLQNILQSTPTGVFFISFSVLNYFKGKKLK